MATPQLVPIKDGWAALAERWAVHGATKEEALFRFEEAEQMHRDLDARAEAARLAEGEHPVNES